MKSTRNELLALFVCIFYLHAKSFAQSTIPTANEFSSNVNYTGFYRYGVNQGYYGSNWPAEDLATIASGSPSLNVKGVGVKTFRIPLNDDHLTDFGINAELGKVQYYTSLGAGDLTALVGMPHSTHKWDTTFAGSPEPAKVFKNLYLPVWLDAAKTQINPNNYFANYLYNVIRTYGSYVKFWEVINEPDFTHSSAGWLGDTNPVQPGSWFDHNPTPLELENLRTPIFYFIRELRVAWEVIKRLQPNSYVGIGGLGYRSFLDAVLRNTDNPVDGSVTPDYPNKGGAYFEILSFHDYPQYGLSNWDNTKGQMIYYRHSDAAVNAFLTIKNNMNDVLTRYGYNNSQYPSKQYICTETGVSKVMGGTDWGSNEGQKNYQIKGQIAAQKNGIKQLYWYLLGDGTTTNQFDQMGLYYYFGNTTPYNNLQLTDQGKAMKTTSDLLYGKVYDAAQTAALNLPSTIDGAAFRASNGSYTYVLWAKTTTDLSEYASAIYNFPQALVPSGTLTRKEWDFSQTNSATSISSNNINLTVAATLKLTV